MARIIFLILILIPFCAAIGHDIWYYTENQEEGFRLSELGWVWHTHHKESHDEFIQMLDDETASNLVVPVLEMKTILVGGIITGLFLLIIFVYKMLSDVNLAGSSATAPRMAIGRERGPGKKINYKRK